LGDIRVTAIIRLLVAEDHLVARVGLTAIISTQPDMTVVAEAEDGPTALELFRRHLPDVTLLDMRMPGLSGIDVASAIHASHPDAKTVMLTSYGGVGDVRRSLAAGMKGYLTKDVRRDELLKAIRTVAQGGMYLPQALSAALEAQDGELQLSTREIQVLELIVAGLPNKSIAHTLNIAEATAKHHVRHILHKLGAQDRTQAATAAIQRGIVQL
jgi:two-component system NarL family response regulator